MSDYRKCSVAGRFYPSSASECISEIEKYTSDSGNMQTCSIGGIVPHAGWVFSGATAGKVFASLKASGKNGSFVVLGAAHRHMRDAPVMMNSGVWQTPLGDVEIDVELALRITNDFPKIQLSSDAHDVEHSIEVNIPFIKHLFPDSKILPILVPPGSDCEEFGKILGNTTEDSGAFVLGSTDLTHYGPEYGFAPKGTGPEALAWVKNTNDKRFIDLVCDMKAGELVAESKRHFNACGAGAATAATAAAKVRGAQKGVLLEYTTSHDAIPERRVSMFVGYAGIGF